MRAPSPAATIGAQRLLMTYRFDRGFTRWSFRRRKAQPIQSAVAHSADFRLRAV